MLTEPDNRYDAEAQKKGKELGTLIGDLNNGHARKHIATGIVRGLMGNHRTLQSQGIACLLEALAMYGEECLEQRAYDARNEDIVRRLEVLAHSLRGAATVPFI